MEKVQRTGEALLCVGTHQRDPARQSVDSDERRFCQIVPAMLAVFGRINVVQRKPVTFDNDTAIAQNGLQQSMRDTATRFCDAYASWRKRGVENANSRLRRFLSRQLDVDRLSDEEIHDIVIITNLTPKNAAAL